MRLTIVETGLPPEPIRAKYADGYPHMFEALLQPHSPEMTFETVSVVKGDALPDPETLDAILITGSAYGVYDDVPWIRLLKEWIGFAAEHQVPMIGVCFGHQIIADALGGDVRKSEKGWGIGRHTYTVFAREHWMQPCPDRIAIGVSHQDQVLVPPPDARVLAGNDFAPNAVLSYSRGPVLSFQCHPEFSDTFLKDLYGVRRGTKLTEAQVSEAEASLTIRDDNTLLAKWIVGFLVDGLTRR